MDRLGVWTLTLGEARARVSAWVEVGRKTMATAPLAETGEAFLELLDELDGVPDRPPEDEWLTAEQAAKLLQISTKQLHEIARTGKWPWAKRVSPRKWRFSKQGLARYMSGKG